LSAIKICKISTDRASRGLAETAESLAWLIYDNKNDEMLLPTEAWDFYAAAQCDRESVPD